MQRILFTSSSDESIKMKMTFKESRAFKIISDIIRIAVVAAVLALVLTKLTTITERKASREKYGYFFEESDNIDVLFVGSSHTINGVFPMELWDEQGITSYNIGGHGNVMATNYWSLLNALDYADPKLVVIDVMNMEADEKTSGQFSHVHLSLDAFPLSRTKYRAISDLLDDPGMAERLANSETDDQGEERTKLGILWDYSVYHNRWKELDKKDFEPEYSIEMGAESRVAVAQAADYSRIDKNERWQENVSTDYLRRTISECQSRGIDVLLTFLPFPANEVQQLAANNAIDIAEEMNVDFIDFLDLEVVDFDVDLYDSDSHLNTSGARKATKYLGQYIRDNYDIPDRRSDETCTQWNDYYVEYVSILENELQREQRLDNYLMLLADDKYKVSMELRNDVILSEYPYPELINNLSMENAGDNIYTNCDMDVGSEPETDDYDVRILVYDAKSGEMIDDSFWNYNNAVAQRIE